MNKLFLVIVLFTSFYSYSCSYLLDTEMRLLDSTEELNLCEYQDSVLLIVNVASRCGYTYQYASLQKLYDKYKDQGFVVLGVPSRDFFQEYSDETDVAEFCSTEYGVNFPMFATSKVTGRKANPLYKKSNQQGEFTRFLVYGKRKNAPFYKNQYAFYLCITVTNSNYFNI